MVGIEPTRPQWTLDFESSASANSATSPSYKIPCFKLSKPKARTGFEPAIGVLQTPALPLGYRANTNKKTGLPGFEPGMHGIKTRCLTAWLQPNKKGRLTGFEPAHVGSTSRCVNHFTTTAILNELCYTGVAGVEPTSTVLETVVLPLNYTPRMEGEGFEPSNSKEDGFTVRCV